MQNSNEASVCRADACELASVNVCKFDTELNLKHGKPSQPLRHSSAYSEIYIDLTNDELKERAREFDFLWWIRALEGKSCLHIYVCGQIIEPTDSILIVN